MGERKGRSEVPLKRFSLLPATLAARGPDERLQPVCGPTQEGFRGCRAEGGGDRRELRFQALGLLRSREIPGLPQDPRKGNARAGEDQGELRAHPQMGVDREPTAGGGSARVDCTTRGRKRTAGPSSGSGSDAEMVRRGPQHRQTRSGLDEARELLRSHPGGRVAAKPAARPAAERDPLDQRKIGSRREEPLDRAHGPVHDFGPVRSQLGGDCASPSMWRGAAATKTFPYCPTA